MELIVNHLYCFTLIMTPEDCTEHGFNLELLKELELYEQTKSSYQYIPDRYLEPPIPPKKPSLLKRLWKLVKKEKLTEIQIRIKEQQEKDDIYYRSKVEALRAQGIKIYSKADLVPLNKNKFQFSEFLTTYIRTETEKEKPPFKSRGHLIYRYSFTDEGNLEIHVETAIWAL